MRIFAPGSHTRYISFMIPINVSVFAPRCSSTCVSRISETEFSGHGHGSTSRSHFRSGSPNLSTFTKPGCGCWPEPRLSLSPIVGLSFHTDAKCRAARDLRCSGDPALVQDDQPRAGEHYPADRHSDSAPPVLAGCHTQILNP